MEVLQSFPMNVCIYLTYAFLLFYPTNGYPAHTATSLQSETNLESAKQKEGDLKHLVNCKTEVFNVEDVLFLNDSDIYLTTKNVSVHSSDYIKNNGKVYVCFDAHDNSKKLLITECEEKFSYDSHDFQILPNRSASLFGQILSPEEYELKDGILYACAEDYEDDEGVANSTATVSTLTDVSINIGKIGSGISIVALIIHLSIFCFLPNLRNLPGYNLATLSVAFLFAYAFVIIGQIPEVLGVSCVVSGVLQQNFFLAAFFCMNVMAFDVWRTLRLATTKLIVGSNNVRKRQFLWYSLYTWGIPLIISSAAVLADNINGVPKKMKPYFGRDDICWMTNNFAKAVFFAVPAFTLFVINAIFFIHSSIMISTNSMRSTNDQQKQAVKFNHILYIRLGLMMGLSWLMGILALIWKNEVVWLIHDLLNSLQGLFLFLLFTCTRKVMKNLKERFSKVTSTSSSSSEKQSTLSSKVDSHQL